MVAIPLDEAIFKTPTEEAGPLFSIAILVGLVIGAVTFIYVRNPDSVLSRQIRRLVPGKKRQQEQPR